MRNLRESVRLATLIDHANGGSFGDLERVRFEVRVGIGSSRLRLAKQREQRCAGFRARYSYRSPARVPEVSDHSFAVNIRARII